jgi:hypothetical protein
MKITCPSCKSLVPASNLNVGTDVAVCENCQEAFSISSVLNTGEGLEGFDIHDPPRGAWFEDTGIGWRIGATTRSPVAFFLVPFMCVWSGGSLGGIYGSQIVTGEFNLLLSLFGIPFVLGTLLFGSIAVMSVCGQIMVTIDGSDGRVFQGVGPVGWTRRFDWRLITAVEENRRSQQHSDGNVQVIALVGQSRLKFGAMLTDARRFYFLQALRTQLASRM